MQRGQTVIQETAELEENLQQLDESFFLGEVIETMYSDERYSQPWRLEVLLNKSRISFNLDSGADVTVVPPDLYEKLYSQSGELQPSGKVLMGPCSVHAK